MNVCDFIIKKIISIELIKEDAAKLSDKWAMNRWDIDPQVTSFGPEVIFILQIPSLD